MKSVRTLAQVDDSTAKLRAPSMSTRCPAGGERFRAYMKRRPAVRLELRRRWINAFPQQCHCPPR
jgi:hypothetical protein